MNTGSTRKLLVVSFFALSGLALAACSGIPPSAAAQMDREALATLSDSTIDISSSSELTVGGEIEFNGTVESIAGADWTIGGVAVLVAPGTEINGAPGLGDVVKVHGLLQSDGSVLAFEIDDSPAPGATPQAGETEFAGTVESITGDVWTIGGQAVMVGGSTEIKGSPSVGDAVKVHGLLQSDGSIMAREIEKLGADDSQQENGQETEFTGVVASIAGGVWSVGGRAVGVNGSTEIKGSPAVGDTVKVHAIAQPDGSLLAREIEKAGADGESQNDDSSGSKHVITGTLEVMSGEVWTIGGVQVRVSISTDLKGDPQVGDVVKVEGTLLADGSIQAHEIEVEDELSGDDDSQDDSDSEDETEDDSGEDSSDSSDDSKY